ESIEDGPIDRPIYRIAVYKRTGEYDRDQTESLQQLRRTPKPRQVARLPGQAEHEKRRHDRERITEIDVDLSRVGRDADLKQSEHDSAETEYPIKRILEGPDHFSQHRAHVRAGRSRPRCTQAR